jgi:hypothetical protein
VVFFLVNFCYFLTKNLGFFFFSHVNSTNFTKKIVKLWEDFDIKKMKKKTLVRTIFLKKL